MTPRSAAFLFAAAALAAVSGSLLAQGLGVMGGGMGGGSGDPLGDILNDYE